MFTETITYPAALLAGLLSFFSPCVLPLIPAYFTFITGLSLDELTDAPPAGIRRRVILSTLAYVCGFSVVFILLGASASWLGGLVSSYSEAIRIAGGTVVILLGVHLTGIIRFRGLEVEKRLHLKRKPLHLLGTFFIGMAFAAGWSPCIGPLLGSILIVAGSQDTVREGVILLSIYSGGLALPFILISVFINFLLHFIRRANRALRYVNAVSGVLLIVVGLMLVTNKIQILSNLS